MKSLLVVFTLLFAFTAQAQDAPKNQEVITVNFDSSEEEAFKTIGRLLVKEGFKLASSEPVLMMLSTEPTAQKVTKMQKVNIQLNVEIGSDSTGSFADVSGMWIDPAVFAALGVNDVDISTEGTVIKNGRMLHGKVFKKVVKMLSSIEGATISYKEVVKEQP